MTAASAVPAIGTASQDGRELAPAGSDNRPVTKYVVTDAQIEDALLAVVCQRGPLSSACPSEVARGLCPHDWRDLMPRVRDVAAHLAQRGSLMISQRGQFVPPHGPWRGPIRISLPLGNKKGL